MPNLKVLRSVYKDAETGELMDEIVKSLAYLYTDEKNTKLPKELMDFAPFINTAYGVALLVHERMNVYRER